MEGVSRVDKIKLAEIVNPKFGMAFKRISNALHAYSQDFVEWTTPDKAQATIIHVVGGEEYQQALDLKNAVAIQHCIFTTGVELSMWEKIWQNSLLSISFHDLHSYSDKNFNAISVPWGAEPSIFFREPNIIKDQTVFTTGHVAHTEHLPDILYACQKANKRMYHTGENFSWDRKHYQYLSYMDDAQLRKMFNRTQYVGCLRGIEGFEMMGIEGSFCGAVPIVPDLHTYRWYKGFGKFIDMRKGVVEQLEAIFKEPY